MGTERNKMLITKDDYIVNTGDIVKFSGYYEYVKNAIKGEIPCLPEKGEGVRVIMQNTNAPTIESCRHAAVWRLVEKLP